MKKIISITYKIILLSLVCFALYQEIIKGGIRWRVFLFFTTQSNILVALSLILLIFTNENRQSISILRGITLISITITSLIYNFVIYKVFQDWNTPAYTFTRITTHIIAPIGFIIDWIVFGKHGNMKWKHTVFWLLHPLIYGIVSLYLSFKTGKHLYFFLNFQNGIVWIYFCLGFFAVLLFILIWLFIKIDKKYV